VDKQKISGYRELSVAEVSEINRIKGVGEVVRALVDGVASLPGVDPRWVAIAKTDLQKGFMELVRAIAQPESF